MSSHDPIAYTYEADTHCPPCAVARFGTEPGQHWPPEAARDQEGNPVGAIAPWDEWCNVDEPGRHVLACGTCGEVIEDHDGPEPEYVTCCPACGEPIDYCQGHGEIGDPFGAQILAQHDAGNHRDCHWRGCDNGPMDGPWDRMQAALMV